MMLQFKLFLISITFAVLCQCSDPVNPADKETQIKQLEEVSAEFFVAVYRQDTAKLDYFFADEVIMKPYHFFFKNVMGRVPEESVIDLKIDKKTHISKLY